METRRTDKWLLGLVDLGLAGVVLLVPFVMGGRQALGQLVLVLLTVVTASAWCIRQGLRQRAPGHKSVALLLILGGLLLLAVQLVPWPAGLNLWASPSTSDILPLWTSAGPLGDWRHVSLSPASTQSGLGLYIAYALLFLVVVERTRETADVERLLSWIALSTAAMAAFGLVQYLFGNGKFYWFYEHPLSATNDVVKGAFANRNHFADFLALGTGPLIWWFHAGADRAQRGGPRWAHWSAPDALKSLALTLVVFAGLLSLSRAGVSVMLLAGAVSVGIYFRGRVLRRRFVFALTGLALLVAALLTIHGSEGLSQRLHQLSSGSLDQLDQHRGRRRVWEAAVRAIADFPLLGTGVGSHRHVVPMYLNEPTESEYTHADNSYLQLVEETGITGAVVALVCIVLCGWWCVCGLQRASSSRSVACIGAVTAGLVANLVHAVVDFVWYVPGCMAIVVILAACAARLYQLQSSGAWRPAEVTWRPAAWATPACVVLGGMALVSSFVGPALAEPHWHRYLVMARPQATEQPTSADFVVGDDDTADVSLRLAAELESVLQWTPDHARAHLHMAIVCLDRFNHAQRQAGSALTLVDVREAALASQINSPDVLREWLFKATGPHAALLEQAYGHARRALELCPLEGGAYFYLSELSFLTCSDPALRGAYLDQALKVRPWQGNVLLAAGNHALASGELTGAIACWRRGFHSGARQQAWLVDCLAGQIPVTFFTDYLTPDLPGYRLLYARYRDCSSPDQWTAFLHRYITAAEVEAQAHLGPPAAKFWLASYHLRAELRDHAGGLATIEQALACDPSDYDIHHFLAQSLLNNGHFAAAREQAQWCLQRRSDDASSQDILARALKCELAFRPPRHVLQQ